MQRKIATLPEGISELCLVRLDLKARRWTALPYLGRTRREVERGAASAIASGAGLLHSDSYSMGRGHFGVLQYWRSFDDLEQWSRRAPHSEWWRGAVDRARTREDFGIYHEVFLVPRAAVEAIALDCPGLGIASFGIPGDPVGTMTTSRDRLGRRVPKP